MASGLSDIEEIKARLPIEEVIKQYVPGLKNAGRSMRAPCPFHQEKSPSFFVTPDLGIFKCFGCGESGDVISFIQKIERVEFGEALEIAADKAGYKLTGKSGKQNSAQAALGKRNLEANALAAKFWHYLLMTHQSGKTAREYARGRGLRGEELQKFQIGYAPKGENLVHFLHKKGFSESDLVQFGLAVNREGKVTDKFRDRLVLPIQNTKGEIVGFSGRIVTPNEFAPKYLNSPETPVYRKSEVVMGIYQAKEAARKHKVMVLQEGNIDILSSHMVGVENIVASGGTAITLQQMKLIKRYAETVHLAFDNDPAGFQATIKAVEFAEKIGLAHKTIDLQQFKDPDEMIKADPQKWLTAVTNPRDSIELIMHKFEIQYDLATAQGKSQFVAQMQLVIGLIADEVARVHYADQIALLVGVNQDVILRKLGKNTQLQITSPSPTQKQTILPVFSNLFSQQQIYILALVLELGKEHLHKIDPSLLSDSSCLEIWQKLNLLDIDLKSVNFSSFADTLNPTSQEALQQILAIDLPSQPEQSAKEFARTLSVLQTEELRHQILALRQELHRDPENITTLEKLQSLTSKLKPLN